MNCPIKNFHLISIGMASSNDAKKKPTKTYKQLLKNLAWLGFIKEQLIATSRAEDTNKPSKTTKNACKLTLSKLDGAIKNYNSIRLLLKTTKRLANMAR